MKKNKSFLLTLILSILITPFMFSQWNEMDKIVANDRQSGDLFSGQGGCGSRVVSVFGDIAVVGAPNNALPGYIQTGAAYIYRKNSNCDWIQVQKITATVPESGDHFGWAVAIYNGIIVVGAPGEDHDEFDNPSSYLLGSGSAYIFKNISGTWVQTQKIVAGNRTFNGAFGYDVDITRRRLIVGTWGDDGDLINPYLPDAGAAYVFADVGLTWALDQKLVAADRGQDDWFGCAVAISNDFAVVGAFKEDHDAAGAGTSYLMESGSAYIFERNTTWNQVGKVTSSDRGENEYFGQSVDIDSNFVIVGAWADSLDENALNPIQYAGSAFIFERNTMGLWSLDAKLDASDRAYSDQFGSSVAISNKGTAVVGASGESNGVTLTSAGAAYIFNNTGGIWAETQKIVASDRFDNDRFGRTVALYDDRIVVGAHLEDEDDALVPANTLPNAGSAYVFQNNTDPADEPTISASTLDFCTGTSVVLTVTGGNLNGATNWQWYTGSCNGTIIGVGPSITVTPGSVTTYYVNGVGSCITPGICSNITLNPVNPGWHQTTKNAQGRDVNKDVITDGAGNVYVAGYFTKQTTLDGGTLAPDITMNGSPLPLVASYIAKYSPCGELLWEAHSKESGNNQANSITLDVLHNRVCITGVFSSNLTFTSSACPGTPLGLATTNTKGYVAAFDMNTGCIIYVDPVNIGAYTTYCEAITINELTGDLYVGGDYSPISTSAPSSFVARYNYSTTGLGTASSIMLSTSLANQTNRLNDMDYNESNNALWAIGDYRKDVQFPGFPLVAPTPVVDAFLLKCTDVGGASLSVALTRKGNCSNDMTGEGICVDESTGLPYITGTYKNLMPNTPNAFQETGLTLNYPTGSGYKSYMIKFSPGSSWAKTGVASTSNAYGKSVSFRNNKVYFTGTYMNATLNLTSHPFLNYVVSGSPANKLHSYVAIYLANGGVQARNATIDPVSNNANHEAESVYTGTDGKCYVAGTYFRYLDDYTPTITYSSLLSTGLGGHTNGFILRVDGSSAAFRESGAETGVTESSPYEETDLIHIYPNPTNNLLNIELKKISESNPTYLTLSTMDGKVLSIQKMNATQFTLNLSEYQSGIYFVKVNSEETSFQIKIIKID